MPFLIGTSITLVSATRYYSGYRGHLPYTTGYRGLGVNVGYGVTPIGYLG